MVSWSMHWAMRSLARPNSASSATADSALYTLMGLVLGRANCRGPSGPSTVMRRAFSSMALTWYLASGEVNPHWGQWARPM